MKLSLRLLISFLFLAVFGAFTPNAYAQCRNCLAKPNFPPTEVGVLDNEGDPDAPSLLTDFVRGPGHSVIPSGYDLQNGSYLAWCIDTPTAPVFGSFKITTPISTLDPVLQTLVTVAPSFIPNWNKINYVLNHKGGADYHDIQRAIWILLGQPGSAIDSTFPDFGGSAALIADANANGAGYIPAAGNVMGVIMPVDGFGGMVQDTMIEMPVPRCGTIGDFVWTDSNRDGLQNDGNAGINGVVVMLKDAMGNPIASTTTANAPDGYTALAGLPPNASGYYQFSGLCQGTYQVTIDGMQPALSGYIPTLVQVGGGTNPLDNNGSPAVVVLATDHAVDETLDFGYFPPAPLLASCAPAITGTVGVAYSSGISASGGFPPYTYSVATGSLPAGLNLDASTGVISGTPTSAGPSSFTVLVTDSKGGTHQTVITSNCGITIQSPLTAACAPATSGQVGVAFSSQVQVFGGIAPFTYAIATGALPAGLTLNTSTGVISGTPTITGSFNYTVTVTDSTPGTHAVAMTAGCSISINPPAMTAACAPANTGTVGTPFSSGIVVTGGTAPFSYGVSSGALPAGLTLNTSTGVISGTPTITGSFNYTVTVTDSTPGTHAVAMTAGCGITINPPAMTAACASTSGQVGVAYSSPIVVTGGTAPFTFGITSGTLPGGLTLNTSSGVISGMPSAAGSFSYTVTVTDSTGGTHAVASTGSCGITIQAPPVPPLTASCAPGTTGQVGVAYSSQVQASGGAAPYTFTLASGALPAGLSMSASGLISGTPTAAVAAAFSVRVTDSTSGTHLTAVTAGCGITVAPAPVTATCAPGTAGVAGVAYSSQVQASGGTAPYTFTLNSGTLPTGLSLSSTGLISGTPTTSAAFSFTVKVTDSTSPAHLTATTSSCGIAISAPPTPSASCVTIAATQGVAIPSTSLIGTGGAGGPYTFTATGLPAGVSISSAGVISGTPSVSGTFNYTVSIKDKNNIAGTLNCSLTVTPVVICAPTTFDLTGGNSASTGTFGNIRTFTAPNGVQVKISAFSRNKTTGAWATAWLGWFSPGLGVTNNSESGTDPSHKIGNVGTQNDYVLMEFSQPVVLNRAYLDAITTDSDITVWIGNKTNPFTTHNTLSDAMLTGLGHMEENVTDVATARWADVNSGNLTGNVIVIAALVSDTSPEDQFKLSKLDIACTTAVPTPTANCVTIAATQGTAIVPATLAGSGGAGGPYTFSAVGLPTGLSMSTTGTISGTPSVSGTFNYTVTVKDKNNVAGTFVCSITVTPAAVCAPSTFDFTTTSSSSSTGTAGNIRTFTASNGVQVKVSGFARNKSTGAWSAAWLGSYTPGLGVTDNSEDGSDPSHRVDNAGTQVNYVLMEFSQNVVLNRAFLDYVSTDSDVQVWIGTKTNPFANHITLSDATLTGLGYTENNLTTSPDSRWADVNAGSLSGNVIVIAALPTNADDDFKLSKLDISCTAPAASAVTPVSLANSYNINGVYADGATFTGGGLDGNGYAYSSNLLGTSLTWNNTPFNFGPSSGSDVVDGNAAVIALPAGNFSAVRVLATAVNGNQTGQVFVVTYTDGTTSSFTQSISDWGSPQSYAGESIAKSMAYRDCNGGTKDNRTFNLYGYSFTLNAAKTVASIKLPSSANVELLAVTLVP